MDLLWGTKVVPCENGVGRRATLYVEETTREQSLVPSHFTVVFEHAIVK